MIDQGLEKEVYDLKQFKNYSEEQLRQWIKNKLEK